jgi:hypothetical protein
LRLNPILVCHGSKSVNWNTLTDYDVYPFPSHFAPQTDYNTIRPTKNLTVLRATKPNAWFDNEDPRGWTVRLKSAGHFPTFRNYSKASLNQICMRNFVRGAHCGSVDFSNEHYGVFLVPGQNITVILYCLISAATDAHLNCAVTLKTKIFNGLAENSQSGF